MKKIKSILILIADILAIVAAVFAVKYSIDLYNRKIEYAKQTAIINSTIPKFSINETIEKAIQKDIDNATSKKSKYSNNNNDKEQKDDDIINGLLKRRYYCSENNTYLDIDYFHMSYTFDDGTEVPLYSIVICDENDNVLYVNDVCILNDEENKIYYINSMPQPNCPEIEYDISSEFPYNKYDDIISNISVMSITDSGECIYNDYK